MAVYVVLEFADDNEAKNCVKEILLTGYTYGIAGSTGYDDYACIPRGVYKKPTMFCECVETKVGNKKSFTGWKRGMKWGWWVCPKCNKPGKKWGQGSSWFSALGINLLPASKIANEFRPQGWKSSAEWTDLLPLLGEPESVEESTQGTLE